nr:MAG TPA: hypothetical protein [Inoviridae sp.]
MSRRATAKIPRPMSLQFVTAQHNRSRIHYRVHRVSRKSVFLRRSPLVRIMYIMLN